MVQHLLMHIPTHILTDFTSPAETRVLRYA